MYLLQLSCCGGAGPGDWAVNGRGLGEVKERSEDLVTNYLGFWCDNGAFYYYHTLPGMDYEQTVLTLNKNLTSRLPIKYINYDSWWYIKGADLGTKSWTPQDSIFPHGMESLYNQTGLAVIAHNRQSPPSLMP